MQPQSLLQRAIRIVPDSESLKRRPLYLDRGDLYFAGDRSFFKITRFLPRAGDLRLVFGLADLQSLLDLGEDLEIVKIDDYTIRAQAKEHALTQAAEWMTKDVEGITVLGDDDYTELPDIFLHGGPLLAMAGEYTSLAAMEIAERGCLVAYLSHTLAVLTGEGRASMDLTQLPSTMNMAAGLKARVAIRGDLFYLRASMGKDGENVIYGGVKFRKPSIPPIPVAAIEKGIRGELEDPAKSELLRFSLDAQGLREYADMMLKLKQNARVQVHVETSKAHFLMRDATNRKYEAHLNCLSTGEFRFSTLPLSSTVIDFLVSAARKTTPRLEFTINVANRIVVIRVSELDAADSPVRAFILRAVDLRNPPAEQQS